MSKFPLCWVNAESIAAPESTWNNIPYTSALTHCMLNLLLKHSTHFHVDWAYAEIIFLQHESIILDYSVYASKHILQKTLKRCQEHNVRTHTNKIKNLSSIFYTFYQKLYDQPTLKCQKPLISGQKRKKTKTIGFFTWDYTDGIKAKKSSFFVACVALFGLN